MPASVLIAAGLLPRLRGTLKPNIQVNQCQMPNNPYAEHFANWPTEKLAKFLSEYDESLENVIKIYGPDHSETLSYKNYVEAMETELKKRRNT